MLAAQIRVSEDSLFGSPAVCHFVIGPDRGRGFDQLRIRRPPFVTMVKATDLLDGDHLGPVLRLDGAAKHPELATFFQTHPDIKDAIEENPGNFAAIPPRPGE